MTATRRSLGGISPVKRSDFTALKFEDRLHVLLVIDDATLIASALAHDNFSTSSPHRSIRPRVHFG